MPSGFPAEEGVSARGAVSAGRGTVAGRDWDRTWRWRDADWGWAWIGRRFEQFPTDVDPAGFPGSTKELPTSESLAAESARHDQRAAGESKSRDS